jgi:hypothetical protein
MNPKCKYIYKKLKEVGSEREREKTLIYCQSSGFKCTYMSLGMEAAAFIIFLTSLSAAEAEN